MPRGRGWFGRGFGNPYPFCRWFPWLPRWWWAYPAFSQPYYSGPWGMPRIGYWQGFYGWPYRYPFFTPYY